MEQRNVRRYTRRLGKVIGSRRAWTRGPWVMTNASDANRRLARRWYPDNGKECDAIADEFGVPHSVACGVVAAWSPRMPWRRNLLVARQFLEGMTNLGLGASERAANAVLINGIEALNGQKTSSFAWNLAGDYDAVTIDVWMMRACGEDDQDTPRTVQYREMSAAVRRLARRHGIPPAEMQALIWIIYRGSAE